MVVSQLKMSNRGLHLRHGLHRIRCTHLDGSGGGAGDCIFTALSAPTAVEQEN